MHTCLATNDPIFVINIQEETVVAVPVGATMFCAVGGDPVWLSMAIARVLSRLLA